MSSEVQPKRSDNFSWEVSGKYVLESYCFSCGKTSSQSFACASSLNTRYRLVRGQRSSEHHGFGTPEKGVRPRASATVVEYCQPKPLVGMHIDWSRMHEDTAINKELVNKINIAPP